MKNIPKILHLYWGRNKKLSYMKYLTALSFSKLNPDWAIKVWYPSTTISSQSWGSMEQKEYNYQGRDYFDSLKDIPNVEIKELDFSVFGSGVDSLSEVHKSDILRLYLLAAEGGIWSDFDIFYLKPIEKLKISNDIESGICCYGYNSIGFLISNGKNQFWECLFNCSMALVEKNNIESNYQGLGRDLFDSVVRTANENSINLEQKYNTKLENIPFDAVYPFKWNQIDIIFGKEFKLPDNAIGIHWFAGSDAVSKYENIVNKDNIKDFDSCLLKSMGSLDD